MIVLFFSSAIIVFSMPIVITNETIRNVLLVSIIYLCFLYYIYYDTIKCSLLLLATRHLLDRNTWLFPHYYEQLALKIFLQAERSQKKNSKREEISIIITSWNNISVRELQNNRQQKKTRVTASRWSRGKAVAKKKSGRGKSEELVK